MNFISSPVADLAVCVLTWLVLVLFIEMDGRAGVAYNSRALLILMMAVFMFTIKPSAAPVLLAGIFLFMAMALRRQWRAVFFACAAAFMIAVPWLARNVTITGYLLFPFEGIDMFAVDWKLPLEHVRWHANAVKSYAADPGYDLNKPFALGFTDWFPGWFRRLVFIQVTMLVAALMSMVVCLGVLARGLVQSGRLFVRVHLHTIFAVVIMASGMAFWLLKGPDFRLGYGFIGLLAMLLPALLLQRFLRSGLRYAGFPFAGIMFFILVYHYKEIWKNMPAMMFRGLPALRMPETMERVNVGKGVQMNLVLREDSWYAPLPVANNNEFYSILPVPRGAGIAEGFRSAQKRSLP